MLMFLHYLLLNISIVKYKIKRIDIFEKNLQIKKINEKKN